ncbi:MAG: hypothetical protein RLZZ601_2041 [Pseudomonadota bacterium]
MPTPNLKSFVISALCALSVSTELVHAEEALTPIPKIANEWTFDLTPYLWAPGISSTLGYNGRYIKTADLGANNVIGNLKSGGMIAGEVRYGRWGIMADLVSATLQKTGSIPVTPQPGVQVHTAEKGTLQSTIFTGSVTYNLFNNKDTNVDALVGGRWIGITSTLNLMVDGVPRPLSDSKSMSTVDPIVGLKGRFRIADSTWYIPFYGDIGSGGGTTNVTWQGVLGVGKTIEKWADLSLVYRGLYYDMSAGKNNALLQKTTFQGPQLAATFHF